MVRKKGFTLIELLVVIAIIAILAIVILIALSTARDRARQASGESTLSSVNTGASSCAYDDPALDLTAYVAGSAMCTGSSSIWPAAPDGWTNWITINDNTSSDGNWSFQATGTENAFRCTETGCADI